MHGWIRIDTDCYVCGPRIWDSPPSPCVVDKAFGAHVLCSRHLQASTADHKRSHMLEEVNVKITEAEAEVAVMTEAYISVQWTCTKNSNRLLEGIHMAASHELLLCSLRGIRLRARFGKYANEDRNVDIWIFRFW